MNEATRHAINTLLTALLTGVGGYFAVEANQQSQAQPVAHATTELVALNHKCMDRLAGCEENCP